MAAVFWPQLWGRMCVRMSHPYILCFNFITVRSLMENKTHTIISTWIITGRPDASDLRRWGVVTCWRGGTDWQKWPTVRPLDQNWKTYYLLLKPNLMMAALLYKIKIIQFDQTRRVVHHTHMIDLVCKRWRDWASFMFSPWPLLLVFKASTQRLSLHGTFVDTQWSYHLSACSLLTLRQCIVIQKACFKKKQTMIEGDIYSLPNKRKRLKRTVPVQWVQLKQIQLPVCLFSCCSPAFEQSVFYILTQPVNNIQFPFCLSAVTNLFAVTKLDQVHLITLSQ